jgi:hypothetical protein
MNSIFTHLSSYTGAMHAICAEMLAVVQHYLYEGSKRSVIGEEGAVEPADELLYQGGLYHNDPNHGGNSGSKNGDWYEPLPDVDPSPMLHFHIEITDAPVASRGKEPCPSMPTASSEPFAPPSSGPTEAPTEAIPTPPSPPNPPSPALAAYTNTDIVTDTTSDTKSEASDAVADMQYGFISSRASDDHTFIDAPVYPLPDSLEEDAGTDYPPADLYIYPALLRGIPYSEIIGKIEYDALESPTMHEHDGSAGGVDVFDYYFGRLDDTVVDDGSAGGVDVFDYSFGRLDDTVVDDVVDTTGTGAEDRDIERLAHVYNPANDGGLVMQNILDSYRDDVDGAEMVSEGDEVVEGNEGHGHASKGAVAGAGFHDDVWTVTDADLASIHQFVDMPSNIGSEDDIATYAYDYVYDYDYDYYYMPDWYADYDRASQRDSEMIASSSASAQTPERDPYYRYGYLERPEHYYEYADPYYFGGYGRYVVDDATIKHYYGGVYILEGENIPVDTYTHNANLGYVDQTVHTGRDSNTYSSPSESSYYFLEPFDAAHEEYMAMLMPFRPESDDKYETRYGGDDTHDHFIYDDVHSNGDGDDDDVDTSVETSIPGRRRYGDANGVNDRHPGDHRGIDGTHTHTHTSHARSLLKAGQTGGKTSGGTSGGTIERVYGEQRGQALDALLQRLKECFNAVVIESGRLELIVTAPSDMRPVARKYLESLTPQDRQGLRLAKRVLSAKKPKHRNPPSRVSAEDSRRPGGRGGRGGRGGGGARGGRGWECELARPAIDDYINRLDRWRRAANPNL